jgi:hypothetical protein
MYIYIKKMSVTAAIAGTIAKKVFSLAAKDRNILIPLDDIKNTKIITDADLKKSICSHNTNNKRKTNLEKVLER